MEWKLNNNAEPQGSSNGFWYDITDGGYIRLEELLTDNAQIKAAHEAVDLLMSLQSTLDSAELLNEF